MNDILQRCLRHQFGDTLQENIPLAAFTSIKIGGSAEFLVEAHTTDQLLKAFYVARELQLPFYFLAGCSNVLIDDHGLKGLVLINKTSQIQWNDQARTVTVESGYNLDRFVEDVSKRGWADLTFAAGIPGSLGGALMGGAGAFGHLLCEYLLQARVLRRDGGVQTMTVYDLGIEYRTSKARERGDILLDAVMGPFREGDCEPLLAEIRRIKAEREQKHPSIEYPSAGSFFKNLPPQEPGGRRIPAGKYLDEAGCKGMRVGDAGVYPMHANIIVNYGQATAREVNELANQMAQQVKDKFGIELEREVQYLY